MLIAVAGATGKLGRLAVEELLDLGVPAASIVATGRNTDRLIDLAELGVTARRADFDDPASLTAAFAGADRLLLVSGSEVGKRSAQHARVISAAKNAGIGLIAYTSIANADTSSLVLAIEHMDTERRLAASGIAHVVLRNSWYLENYVDQLPNYLVHGMVGAAGNGLVSAASRRDFARAAAVVLTEEGHEGATYELGGEALTMPQIAEAISSATGTTVTYTDVTVDEYAQILTTSGVPAPFAQVLADSDRGLSQGELFVEPSTLERLIGRPATRLDDALDHP